MRIIAALTEAASIRRYPEGVGLPAEPPLIAPASVGLRESLEGGLAARQHRCLS